MVKFVLGTGHEQVKEGNQPPSVTWEKFVPQNLFYCLAILDTPYKLIFPVPELVQRCIQLLHDMCHITVSALSAMSIRQLIVRTPAGIRSITLDHVKQMMIAILDSDGDCNP